MSVREAKPQSRDANGKVHVDVSFERNRLRAAFVEEEAASTAIGMGRSLFFTVRSCLAENLAQRLARAAAKRRISPIGPNNTSGQAAGESSPSLTCPIRKSYRAASAEGYRPAILKDNPSSFRVGGHALDACSTPANACHCLHDDKIFVKAPPNRVGRGQMVTASARSTHPQPERD